MNYVVGVTGGIGSGKSAICREFEALDIAVVDADIVAREVVIPGSTGLQEIIEHFGDRVLLSDGTLNRTQLRDIVFEDDNERKTLEAILHPKIRDSVRTQLAVAESPYCLLCVPLMVERGDSYAVDRLLVIDCPEEIQIARVMARDNLTRDQVLAIMSTQATRQQRLDKADDVIMNDGPLDKLKTEVGELHRAYLSYAAKSPTQRKS